MIPLLQQLTFLSTRNIFPLLRKIYLRNMCFYQCVVGAYIFSQLRKIVLYAKLRTSTSGKYVSFTGKNI